MAGRGFGASKDNAQGHPKITRNKRHPIIWVKLHNHQVVIVSRYRHRQACLLSIVCQVLTVCMNTDKRQISGYEV